MSATKIETEGYLSKQKKTFSHFKNNKRRFNESLEMQENRAKRISFKSYLQELEDAETSAILDEEDQDES